MGSDVNAGKSLRMGVEITATIFEGAVVAPLQTIFPTVRQMQSTACAPRALQGRMSSRYECTVSCFENIINSETLAHISPLWSKIQLCTKQGQWLLETVSLPVKFSFKYFVQFSLAHKKGSDKNWYGDILLYIHISSYLVHVVVLLKRLRFSALWYTLAHAIAVKQIPS